MARLSAFVSLALAAAWCGCSSGTPSDPTGTTAQAYGINGYVQPASLWTPPTTTDVTDHDGSPGICTNGEVCFLADANNDGNDDIIAFHHDSGHGGSTVEVGLSNGQGSFALQGSGVWSTYFCTGTQTCAVGDVDGDGTFDIIAFDPSTTSAWVALSNKWNYVNNIGAKNQGPFCQPGQRCMVADMNGDHHADLVAFTHDSAHSVYVALWNSAQFQFDPAVLWNGLFCQSTETCDLADVDDNGTADLIAYGADGTVWVSNTGRGGYGGIAWGNVPSCDSDYGQVGTCVARDADGDGRADIMRFRQDNTPELDIAFSNGTSFSAPTMEDSYFCIGAEHCYVGHGPYPSIMAVDWYPADPESSQLWVARPYKSVVK